MVGAHGTWQQTGGGKGGGALAVAVIIGAAVIARQAVPAATSAAKSLVELVLVTAGIVAAVAALATVTALALLYRRRNRPAPFAGQAARMEAAQARHVAAQDPPRVLDGGLHIHIHGPDADTRAAEIVGQLTARD